MPNNNEATIEERVRKDKELFLEALSGTKGLVRPACRMTGIHPSTYYRWLNEDASFKDKVEDVKELQKDFAESLILKKIEEEDTTMLIFYAKTQMKDRGYTTRTEVVGKDGEAIIPKQKIDITKLTDEQREVLLSIGLDLINKKE